MKLSSILQIFWPFSGGFGTRPPGTVVERYDLIGTSTARISLTGTDATRLSLVGTDTTRITLEGTR